MEAAAGTLTGCNSVQRQFMAATAGITGQSAAMDASQHGNNALQLELLEQNSELH
jgi:hypothetical protein